VKLIVYVVDGETVDIHPAPVTRDWMDKTFESFAYRCLPLNIANSHGWEILCPETFEAVWNGGPAVGDVRVSKAAGTTAPAVSHFGGGILTFRIQAVFRTEPGYDLMVQGPVNCPKDGIGALSGIIETDWSPYTFTMNWLFTRKDTPVQFRKGEPICHFFPVPHGMLDAVEPERRSLSDDLDLKRLRDSWRADRERFLRERTIAGTEAASQKWQKHYYLGQWPDGTSEGIADHRIKPKTKPFRTI
jgi:hypothetical protein